MNEEEENQIYNKLIEKIPVRHPVIFLQHTLHSELAQRVRRKLSELEKVGQIKIKIVERSGTKLEELLHKSNVWEEKD